MRKIVLAAALTGATLGGAALAQGAERASSAAAKRVTVADNLFKPGTVGVARRGRVTWVWRGDSTHNVTFVKAPRGARRPGRCGNRSSGTCTRGFSRRGTYSYVCTIHAGMAGRVRVR